MADVQADFEKDWAEAEAITPDLITQMMMTRPKKSQGRGASRSRSSDEVSRSLSSELESVDED